MKPTPSVLAALALVMAADHAAAQSFNVSFGTGSPAVPGPSAAFGAAAGQTGIWNSIRSPTLGSAPLLTTAGAASGVTITTSLCDTFTIQGASASTGDFSRLMDNAFGVQNNFPFDSSVIVTFRGLSHGAYTAYTYASAPGGFDSSATVVTFGTGNFLESTIAGPCPTDAFAAGITHVAHQVVTTNGLISVWTRTAGFFDANLNGIQLVPAFDVAGACAVNLPPAPVIALSNQTAAFSAAISGDVRAYRWTRNGTDLADIRGISGSQTTALSLTEVRPGDAGNYALRYLCGGEWRTTPAAALTVIDCPADFNRSGTISTQDIFDFLEAYFTGCP